MSDSPSWDVGSTTAITRSGCSVATTRARPTDERGRAADERGPASAVAGALSNRPSWPGGATTARLPGRGAPRSPSRRVLRQAEDPRWALKPTGAAFSPGWRGLITASRRAASAPASSSPSTRSEVPSSSEARKAASGWSRPAASVAVVPGPSRTVSTRPSVASAAVIASTPTATTLGRRASWGRRSAPPQPPRRVGAEPTRPQSPARSAARAPARSASAVFRRRPRRLRQAWRAPPPPLPWPRRRACRPRRRGRRRARRRSVGW